MAGPIPAMHPDLTWQRASAWRWRIPNPLFAFGPLATAIAIVALTWNLDQYPSTIAQAVDWAYFATWMAFGALLATCLLSWYVPRLGALIAMVSAATYPADSTGLRIIAWCWAALLLTDTALRLRQTILAGWNRGRPARRIRIELDSFLIIRLVTIAVLVALLAVGSTWWLSHRAELVALGERAQGATGTVLSQNNADDSVQVRIGTKTYEFWVEHAADFPVGSQQQVWVDPEGKDRPYGLGNADQNDWTMVSIPIGAGVWLLVVIAAVPPLRRRRLQHLATQGTPVVHALVRGHPTSAFALDVFADDDPGGRHPLVMLPSLDVIEFADDAAPSTGSVRLGLDVGPPPIEPAMGPGRQPEPRPELPWNDWTDDEDEFDLDLSIIQKAEIVGLRRDGDLCLVRLPDGLEEIVLASRRPARDRYTLGFLWRLVTFRHPDRHPVRPDAASEPSAEPDTEPEPDALTRYAPPLLAATAWCGVPILIAVLGLLIWWLFDANSEDHADLWDLPMCLCIGPWLTATWWTYRRPVVAVSRLGLRIAHMWLDCIIPPSRIESWHNDGREVALNLINPIETLSIEPRRPHRRKETSADDQIRARSLAHIEQAVFTAVHDRAAWARTSRSPRHSRHGTAAGSPQHREPGRATRPMLTRPSSTLLVAAVTVLVVLGSAAGAAGWWPFG